MLSLLKKTAVRLLTNVPESEECQGWQGEAELSLNVDDLCEFVPSLPGVPWHRVAGVCSKTVSPVYNAIRKTLEDDVDNLVQLMAELGPLPTEEEDSVCDTVAEEACPPTFESRLTESSRSTYPRPVMPKRRKRKPDPDLDNVLVIPSTDPSIPTIVVTPCPSQPRDRSCLVPFQDVSFGNRLAVPMHPVVNDTHPPQIPQPLPFVERWSYKDGHWCAHLPTPEEQMQRGLFSRPLSRRRRPCADSRSRHPRTRRPSPSPSLA